MSPPKSARLNKACRFLLVIHSLFTLYSLQKATGFQVKVTGDSRLLKRKEGRMLSRYTQISLAEQNAYDYINKIIYLEKHLGGKISFKICSEAECIYFINVTFGIRYYKQ